MRRAASTTSRETSAASDVTGTPADTPTQNQPLRAGDCRTQTKIIHLRSIDADDPAPEGWSGPIAPVHLGNGVTYVTYWLLTPR